MIEIFIERDVFKHTTIFLYNQYLDTIHLKTSNPYPYERLFECYPQIGELNEKVYNRQYFNDKYQVKSLIIFSP